MIRWKKRRGKFGQHRWAMFVGSSRRGSARGYVKRAGYWWEAFVYCAPPLTRKFATERMWDRAPTRAEAMAWCERMRAAGSRGRELRMLPPRLFTKDGKIEETEAPHGSRNVVIRRIEQWGPLRLDERGLPEMPKINEIVCEGRRYAIAWDLPAIGEYVDVMGLAFIEPGGEAIADEWMKRYLNDIALAAKERAYRHEFRR